ncbi:tRNA N(3)-methylcytidine methyltransferase METTL6-like [Anneissia japonica]|uniref:tRNA N(3)-methylcytidine methyltransferase METTL6-like n=1 Tax=Anneissia japonica TaxID=1529436 RepID=UPI00142590D7|nr:tRNA N(3)-methylcytidine methyltransferase METTL6-like [Anneissia japonica]XP_033108273.1 tRNA N(3)-methylcytidine methyltransferase METTL6-like [Anneissia japonica]
MAQETCPGILQEKMEEHPLEHPRMLTDEEQQKLESDSELVSDFKRCKLEKEAQKNWDLFYKRNSVNFFKDRHWTTREFEELKEHTGNIVKRSLLEVGCGVGNALFPLLEENKNLMIYACDFSPRAVQFVKDNPLYNESRVKVFQCDLTKDKLKDNIPEGTIDMTSMLFVLSAIHPDKMPDVLKNIFKVLKPGGVLLFRDYGLYDHAMLRFSKGHKISENFYVRQDGTRAYYFTTDFVKRLCQGNGFIIDKNEYVLRETVNKKEGLCVPRVFVQSKFIKPNTSIS